MPLPLDHLRRSQQVLRDNCLSLPPRCSFFHRQSRHTLDETANLSSSKVHNQQILSISGENIAEEIVKGRIDKYDHVCIGGRSTKRNDLRPLTGVGADTSLCPLLFPGVWWGSTYPTNDHSKWQLRETRLKWLQYNHREKKNSLRGNLFKWTFIRHSVITLSSPRFCYKGASAWIRRLHGYHQGARDLMCP